MSDVNLSISKELIQPIIDAKVSAAVCEALNGSKNIVANVVATVLDMKVNDQGERSSYSNDIPYVQWLCNDAIKNAAKQAIVNYISASNEKLILAIEKNLQNNTKDIAINLVSSFINATKNSWSMNVDVSVKPRGN